MENTLIYQVNEFVATSRSAVEITLKLVYITVKLLVSTVLFLTSFGTLVKWAKPISASDIEIQTAQDDSSSSNNATSSDDPTDSHNYEVRYQLASALTETPSTLALNELIRESEFSRKESWSSKSHESEDVIIIPSLSLDSSELSKITAVNYYEERQLCTLFYLTNPKLRLVYVTSQPIDKSILDYYLNLIQKTSLVTANEAYKRLRLLSCNDPSIIPLTSKVLRRPKIIQKIKNWINPRKAHMICFISSNLEKDLALQLQVPLFSNDPLYSYWGTKAGSREAFETAEVPFAEGSRLVFSVPELVDEIADLYVSNKFKGNRMVVKLNVGFSGEGNAILETKHFNLHSLTQSIRSALAENLEYCYKKETWESFQEKIKLHGALVEEWIEDVVDSPSCQALINPKGEVELLSTHQQMLGDSGMVYMGCEFPANDEYRTLIQETTVKIGKVLSDRGCRERFGIDYVVKKENGKWIAYAIEINLRWGGTSHPMIFAKYLTNAELTPDGLLLACDGQFKYYIATDNVSNDIYTGLTPEDFIDFINTHAELQFDEESLSGVVFHLISAISVYGKFGFVAIGNSRKHAREIYEKTLLFVEQEASEIAQHKKFTELDLKITPPSKLNSNKES